MLERDLADTQPPVAVAAIYPQALIDQATNDVRTKVALVIGFVLLAILILAELLVRSITGVLGMFSRRAEEIGEGRFKGDLPVQGNDEFATSRAASTRWRPSWSSGSRSSTASAGACRRRSPGSGRRSSRRTTSPRCSAS